MKLKILSVFAQMMTIGILAANLFAQNLTPPVQANILRFGGMQTAMLTDGSALTFTNQATVECWIYPEAASPNGNIVGNTTPALRFNSSGVPYFTAGGLTVTATAALPLSTWTHLAGTTDGTTMRLFVNGQQVAQRTAPASVSYGGNFSIGGETVENGGRADNGISGALRQIRVWNRGLTAAEIQQNAGIYLNGNENGLRVYFPLDDGNLTSTRNLVTNGARLQIGLRQYAFELLGEPQWTTPQMLETGPYFTATELPINTQGQSIGGYDGRLIDFDSDGDLDVLMNDFDSSSSDPQPLLAFRNDGSGNFTNATTAVLGNSPPTEVHARDYAIADFNGDGRMDAFMADHGYDAYPFPGGQSRILIQTTDGRLVDETSTRIPTLSAFTHHVSAGDIDRDGDIDLYMCNLAGQAASDVPKQPRFYVNNGNGVFTSDATRLPEAFRNVSGGYTASEFLDVDNDGDLDLVLGAADYMGYPKDVLLLNNGTGNFTLAPDSAMPPRYGGATWGTVEIAHADVNNDGYQDLAMSTEQGYAAVKIQLLLNNRDGTFTDATNRFEQNFATRATDNPNGSYWVKCLFPTDFNNDGLIDFVAAPDIQQKTRLFMNKGQGYFADVTGLMPPGAPGVIGVALPGDLDGDKDIDMFIPAAYWGRYYTVRNVKRYTVKRPIFDFDGDNKTDIGIFRQSVGEWWIQRSSTSVTFANQFGSSTDKPVPADFTGDGKTDISFFRPSNGYWYVIRSEDSSFFAFPFGSSGDLPAPADFDGDGKADAAVFRPSQGVWYVNKSSGGTSITQFGIAEDKPVVADYDGDAKADIAIFRPSNNSWWHVRSSDGEFRVYQFALGTDKPVIGDWTGDGKADLATYRPTTGEWFIRKSEDLSYYAVPFGAAGDIPAPGDYDGDGKLDTAVYRPTQRTWYINRSTAGILITQFGIEEDKPLEGSFIP